MKSKDINVDDSDINVKNMDVDDKIKHVFYEWDREKELILKTHFS